MSSWRGGADRVVSRRGGDLDPVLDRRALWRGHRDRPCAHACRYEDLGPRPGSPVRYVPARSPSTRSVSSPTWSLPGPTGQLFDQARRCSVRELADVSPPHGRALTRPLAPPRSSVPPLQRPHRTMTVQLPPEPYAALRARVDAWAQTFPTTARRRWTSAAATGSCRTWVGHVNHDVGQPLRRGRPRSPGRPRRRQASDRPGRRARAGRDDRRRDGAAHRLRRHHCGGGRRRRRPHHVRGPEPAVPDRRPTPRGYAAGPTVSVPGLHQRHLHQCAPHRAVETGRSDRPSEPRPRVPSPSRRGAQKRLDHVRERQ